MNSEAIKLCVHLSNIQAATICSIKLNERILEELEADSCNNAKLTELILQLLTQNRSSRTCWRYPFSTDWWDNIVPLFPDKLFRRHFRVDRSIFSYLVEKLRPRLHKENTNWRECISVEKKVAMSLKLLGTTSDYLTVAALFGVGRSTAHQSFKDFINAASEVLVPEEIKFPKSNEDFAKSAKEFEELWGFPMAIGAIDGCHVPFRAPKNLSGDFYNYKGWTSVVLLAICDANGKALWIKSGIPGRHSDSGAFKATKLYRKISQDDVIPSDTKEIEGVQVPYLVLGDSGFGMETWLQKPYTHHITLSADMTLYNYRHSRARRVIENFFGRLKQRFRRLYRGVDVCYKDAHKVIDVAVALHNICNRNRIKIVNTPQEILENEVYEHRFPQPQSSSVQASTRGETIRNALRVHFSKQIQPWER